MSASVVVAALFMSGCVLVVAVLLVASRPETRDPPRVLPAGVLPTDTGGNSADNAGWRGVMLQRINEERRKVGAPPLCLNNKLNAAASAHSADQAARGGSWSHAGSDGSNACQRMQRAGYRFINSVCGENVAEGEAKPNDIMNGWMLSPGHRANLLDRKYSQVGLGRVTTPNGMWWTQNFAASTTESCNG